MGVNVLAKRLFFFFLSRTKQPPLKSQGQARLGVSASVGFDRQWESLYLFSWAFLTRFEQGCYPLGELAAISGFSFDVARRGDAHLGPEQICHECSASGGFFGFNSGFVLIMIIYKVMAFTIL